MTTEIYFLSGLGDLGIDPTIRPYIREQVTLVKICKSGLYQIKTSDGKLFSVPKSNLLTEEQWAEYVRPRTPEELEAQRIALSKWTIQEVQSLQAHHGTDLEDELAAIIRQEINDSKLG